MSNISGEQRKVMIGCVEVLRSHFAEGVEVTIYVRDPAHEDARYFMSTDIPEEVLKSLEGLVKSAKTKVAAIYKDNKGEH